MTCTSAVIFIETGKKNLKPVKLVLFSFQSKLNAALIVSVVNGNWFISTIISRHEQSPNLARRTFLSLFSWFPGRATGYSC